MERLRQLKIQLVKAWEKSPLRWTWRKSAQSVDQKQDVFRNYLSREIYFLGLFTLLGILWCFLSGDYGCIIMYALAVSLVAILAVAIHQPQLRSATRKGLMVHVAVSLPMMLLTTSREVDDLLYFSILWTITAALTLPLAETWAIALSSPFILGLVIDNLPNTVYSTSWRRSDIPHQILIVSMFNIGVVLLGRAYEKQKQHLMKQLETAESEKKQAQQISRLKSQLVATVNHEIRTPLNAIVGFGSLLAQTPLSPEQREYVESIGASSLIMAALASHILDFARLEAEKLKFYPTTFAVLPAVEEVLRVCGGTVKPGVELLTFVSPAVPVEVLADRTRIQQVIINLLSNAAKFTQTGAVTLRVDAQLTTAPADASDSPLIGADSTGARKYVKLIFNVNDTGIGMSEEQVSRLFQPYTEIDGVSRKHNGVGLGLLIAKTLTSRMHGSIGIESKLGFGSSFTATVVVQLPTTHSGASELLPAILRTQSLESLTVITLVPNPYTCAVYREQIQACGGNCVECVDTIDLLQNLAPHFAGLVPNTQVAILIDASDPRLAVMQLLRFNGAVEKRIVVVVPQGDPLLNSRTLPPNVALLSKPSLPERLIAALSTAPDVYLPPVPVEAPTSVFTHAQKVIPHLWYGGEAQRQRNRLFDGDSSERHSLTPDEDGSSVMTAGTQITALSSLGGSFERARSRSFQVPFSPKSSRSPALTAAPSPGPISPLAALRRSSSMVSAEDTEQSSGSTPTAGTSTIPMRSSEQRTRSGSEFGHRLRSVSLNLPARPPMLHTATLSPPPLAPMQHDSAQPHKHVRPLSVLLAVQGSGPDSAEAQRAIAAVDAKVDMVYHADLVLDAYAGGVGSRYPYDAIFVYFSPDYETGLYVVSCVREFEEKHTLPPVTLVAVCDPSVNESAFENVDVNCVLSTPLMQGQLAVLFDELVYLKRDGGAED